MWLTRCDSCPQSLLKKKKKNPDNKKRASVGGTTLLWTASQYQGQRRTLTYSLASKIFLSSPAPFEENSVLFRSLAGGLYGPVWPRSPISFFTLSTPCRQSNEQETIKPRLVKFCYNDRNSFMCLSHVFLLLGIKKRTEGKQRIISSGFRKNKTTWVTAYLRYCFEGTSLSQHLSAFRDRFCRGLSSFGGFLHSLFDFLPYVCAADLLQPLSEHTDQHVHLKTGDNFFSNLRMHPSKEKLHHNKTHVTFTSFTVSEMFSNFFFRTSDVFTVSDSIVFWEKQRREL